jgi:hypothetical protein
MHPINHAIVLLVVQRQLYEAFLRSEIVLSAFDGSPLAALTVFTLQLFCLCLFEMCKKTMIFSRKVALNSYYC